MARDDERKKNSDRIHLLTLHWREREIQIKRDLSKTICRTPRDTDNSPTLEIRVQEKFNYSGKVVRDEQRAILKICFLRKSFCAVSTRGLT